MVHLWSFRLPTRIYTLHARLYRHSYRLQISKGFAWSLRFAGLRFIPRPFLEPFSPSWFAFRASFQPAPQTKVQRRATRTFAENRVNFRDDVVEDDYGAKGNCLSIACVNRTEWKPWTMRRKQCRCINYMFRIDCWKFIQFTFDVWINRQFNILLLELFTRNKVF